MAADTAREALAGVRRLYARRSAPILLELDLTVDPVEGVPGDPVSAALARRRPSLRTIVDGLRRAGQDDRAATLIARIAPCGTPLARVQEIRDAVIAFRDAGGTAFAYADAFGEFGGGTVPYYLACAFDQIWLAPPGDLGLTGVALETPFLRDALDRLGIEIQVGQRHEYKNAANTFVERDFTAAHREASERIVVSSLSMIVDGVAAARGLSPARVRELIDNAPLSAEQARRAGLVDRLGYRDEVYAAARAHARRTAGAATPAVATAGAAGSAAGAAGAAGEAGAGADAAARGTRRADAPAGGDVLAGGTATTAEDERDGVIMMYLAHYQRTAQRREASRSRLPVPMPRLGGRPAEPGGKAFRRGPERRKVIALIHGTGPVLLGRGGRAPLRGPAMASDALTAAFRAAGRDEDVAAAVFRVDSPGGSYVASDLIRREVERFQATGRPVVVSMGSVAASGGYFVALGADAIVAHPGTLTGSIGVLGGKQVVRELLDRIGVRFGAVAGGENALMTSPRREFSPAERKKLDEFLDRVYEDFVTKVAAGRRMTPEAVHEVARGRVWTGADAHERGLVDVLGGLFQACELAWEKAGLPASVTPRLRVLPKLALADRLRPPRSSEDPAAAGVGGAPLAGPLSAGWPLTGTALLEASLEAMAHRVAGGAYAPAGGDVFAAGWGPLAAAAARAGLPAGGPLLMPPLGLVI
ncbi:signal peptide peptidase SppA [Frankia sp. CiP1_Cm_nod2]|uniref:signal peptide peptidase SppA n=2 Tax=unclassified Frankia TaxID=2632575 RepID=UPI00202500E5